ncbi:LysR family transcriptional regulator [Spirochaeta cellobiosiphila]|uniref:LysR family transcriptional regulator n=1 Tax=Spirochaeta cellobiosiphila TaxID=504483 RepID=UPI00048A5008|nr:LysR family transcriptional regulator [Spirochaeta cellobiosiphila]
MNTKALQCFIKVYERKSITSAAKEIFISPQGLSKAIKQLEIELDTELFYRGTQGMEATESGELLYARARHILYLMEDIQKEISLLNGSQGAFQVMICYSISSLIPLNKIYEFTKEQPHIQLKIKEIPDDYSLNELVQEEADVAILLGHEGLDNCEYELLSSGEIVVVVALDHPFAKLSEISIADLENQKIALKTVDSDKNHSIIDKCLELGFSPSIIHESGNLAAIHGLCESQHLVGISIDFVEKTFPNKNLKVVKLKEKIPLNVYFVTRVRDIKNQVEQQFLNYIKQQGI